MAAAPLTPTQRAILAHALDHADECIEWFPSNIHGGTRQKVLAGLAKRGLIGQVGTRWKVIAAGYDTLGVPSPGVGKKRMGQFEAKLDQIIANAEGAPNHAELESGSRPSSRSRSGSAAGGPWWCGLRWRRCRPSPLRSTTSPC